MVTVAAMFWIVWCYFGITLIPFSDTQRRGLVDYSFTTPKPRNVSTSTVSPDIYGTSENQISRIATASTGLRNDPSSVGHKVKDVVIDRSPSLAKGDFALRERNRTLEHVNSQRSSSINSTNKFIAPSEEKSAESFDSKGDTILSRDITQIRPTTASSSIERISGDRNRNTPREENTPLLREVHGRRDINPPEIITQITRNEKSSLASNERILTRTNDGKDISVERGRPSKDPPYPVPNFEVASTRRTVDSDDGRRRYDDTVITRNRDRGLIDEDQYSKGDRRVLIGQDPSPREIYRPTDEERRRDRIRTDDRPYSSDGRRRGEDGYYEDRLLREERYRDRYRDEEEYRAGKRKLDGSPSDEFPRDDRPRQMIPEVIRYSDERKIFENNSGREGRYRDRDPVDDRYSERRRYDASDVYDSLPARRDSYRDRDDRYVERYPEEKTIRGVEEYDDRRVIDDRNRERIQKERYIDTYPSDRRTISERDRYDDRIANDERYRDDDRRAILRETFGDERKRFDDGRNNNREEKIEERYRNNNRSIDERIRLDRDRYRDDRYIDRDENEKRTIDGSRYIPSRYDTDKQIPDEIRSKEKDTSGIRADYVPESQRTLLRSEISNVRSREDLGDSYLRSNSKDTITDTKRERTAEDRYRTDYRDEEYDRPRRYNERDRIDPTKVEDRYIPIRTYKNDTFDDRQRDEFMPSNDKRVILTRNINDDVGTRKDDDVREYRPVSSKEKQPISRDITVDRKSYTAEELENKERNNRRPQLSGRDELYDSDRDYKSYSSRPKDEDEVRRYITSSRRYDDLEYRDRDRYPDDPDERYSRNERRNIRNRDPDRRQDRGDRNRDGYRTDEARISGEDRNIRYRDRYDDDAYDRRVETKDRDRYLPYDEERKYENRDISREISRTPLHDETPDDDISSDRPRRYPDEDNPDVSSTSLSSSVIRKNPSVESTSILRSPSRADGVRRDSSSAKESGYEVEIPLNAKDIIDTALRHSENSDQNSRKVFYPVFDPRISNLTSSDFIRPSERKGTIITSKRRRRREANRYP